ncbi:MFS transporter [Nocardia pseudobrasiliensis]|uniref:EmrB/QacA subfamily drug resistance transporter n=1 Tax=Nocardia pseudobrasiliensis TaxID=45979 RepID=A0A370I742_9NOCA|nr:MFS transporter [Nocardia pseudobrasiliensis]RDI65144.1 EmrB/QacA subfamily drug resistance transporter [Nocardia pseudobrasiliensis]
MATPRGKLTLALLCTGAFVDFADISIVNVAVPSIQRELHLSVSTVQWLITGYLLTYGGLMLLGGRFADLLGRRRILMAGSVIIAVSAIVAGMANTGGLLIGARFAQGVGAALMLPAALSILTTSFPEGRDRNLAMGAWGGVAGLGAASGVILSGLLTEGPGWRWVFFINVPICVLVLVGALVLIPGDRGKRIGGGFDLLGTALATGGIMLLVYGLAEAPDQGWGSLRTIGELGGAVVLLIAFVVNERVVANPVMPLSVFRIRGLAAANLTQLLSSAGGMPMFFFLAIYTQSVLGYSQLEAGFVFLPFSITIMITAGIFSKLVTRIGARAVTVAGALVVGLGMVMMSRISVDGSYLHDLLPGLLVAAVGSGAVFVANTTAANAGVPEDRAGLAAALLNTFQQIGVALGTAVLTALATSRTNSQLAHGSNPVEALNSGLGLALLVGGVIAAISAVTALRTINARDTSAVPGGGAPVEHSAA